MRLAEAIPSSVESDSMSMIQSCSGAREDLMQIESVLSQDYMPVECQDLFRSPESIIDLSNELIKSKTKYLEYLRICNVNQAYIDEVDRLLTPEHRCLEYHTNCSVADAAAGGFLGSAADEFYGVRIPDMLLCGVYMDLLKSNIPKIAGLDDKGTRDFALRIIAYHEFTHILQCAFTNVNNNYIQTYHKPLTTSRMVNKLANRQNYNQLERVVGSFVEDEERQAQGIAVLFGSYDLCSGVSQDIHHSIDHKDAYNLLYSTLTDEMVKIVPLLNGLTKIRRSDWDSIMDSIQSYALAIGLHKVEKMVEELRLYSRFLGYAFPCTEDELEQMCFGLLV